MRGLPHYLVHTLLRTGSRCGNAHLDFCPLLLIKHFLCIINTNNNEKTRKVQEPRPVSMQVTLTPKMTKNFLESMLYEIHDTKSVTMGCDGSHSERVLRHNKKNDKQLFHQVQQQENVK